MTGRPTKLTPELQEKLCALLSEGKFLRHAAAECDISEKTVLEWIRRGHGEDSARDDEFGLYAAFAEACECARARGEQALVDKINTMAVESLDWKAAAWQLERLNPELFHLKTKNEISGPNGGPIATTAKVIVLPPLGADDDKPID